MSKLVASGVVQADADLCNAIEPPARGCSAGGGAQVAIPGDWQSRITLGQDVPGCTYYKPIGGSMCVSDLACARLATPAIVNALTAPQQAQAAALNIKLSTAQVTT